MALPEPTYYRNVQNADIYFADQLFATDWTGATAADKQKALIMASRAIDSLRYRGVKKSLYDALVAAGGTNGDPGDVLLSKTTLTEAEIAAANALQVHQFPRDGSAEAEVWRLTIDAANGTFTLTFNGQTTGNVAYDADAATIQAALEALSNVDPGDLVVTVSDGGTDTVGPYTITATNGIATGNYDDLTADGTNLVGGAATAQILTIEDNVPNAIAYAVFEEARELLAGRDPQQEYRNLEIQSDSLGGQSATNRGEFPPQHTVHQLVSPMAWRMVLPYLNRKNLSFKVRGV